MVTQHTEPALVNTNAGEHGDVLRRRRGPRIPALLGTLLAVLMGTASLAGAQNGGLPPDALVWLRADAGVYRETAGAKPARNGDQVAVWRNQAASGIGDAFAGGRKTAPRLIADGGATFLRFTEAGEFMRIKHEERLDPRDGAYTVVAVIRKTGNGGILAKGNLAKSSESGFNLFAGSAGGGSSIRVRASVGGTGGRDRAGQHQTIPVTDRGILMARFTGGHAIGYWNNSRNGWVEGGAGTGDKHYDGAVASKSDLLIGSYMEAAGVGSVEISEILIYGRELTLAEQEDVLLYLSRKYAIAIDSMDTRFQSTLADREPAVLRSDFIYRESPAPFAHASTVAETPDGIVAAWFSGTREGRADVGIWSARFDGQNWSTPVEIADGRRDDGDYPCWNPVLFQMPDGPLVLFYKTGHLGEGWRGMVRTSDDAGRTWSEPLRLPQGILGPAKNKPVLLANGDLLCPHPTMHRAVGAAHQPDVRKWKWVRDDRLNDGRNIPVMQPSLLKYPDGRLRVLCRSRSEERRVVEAWSADGGASWSDRRVTALPNNNAGIDSVLLEDGRILIVYNPTTDHSRSKRYPLRVSVSDDGEKWTTVVDLETGPGEFSYPAIIQTSDGLVHITYTWRTEKIKHVVLAPEKILGEKSAS